MDTSIKPLMTPAADTGFSPELLNSLYRYARTFKVTSYKEHLEKVKPGVLPETITWLSPFPGDDERDQLFIGTRLIDRENWRYDPVEETLDWHQGEGDARRSGTLMMFPTNFYGIGHMFVGSHYFSVETVVKTDTVDNQGVAGHYLLEFEGPAIVFSVFGQKLYINNERVSTSYLTGSRLSWSCLNDRQVAWSGMPDNGWICFSENGETFDDGEGGFLGKRMSQEDAAIVLALVAGDA